MTQSKTTTIDPALAGNLSSKIARQQLMAAGSAAYVEGGSEVYAVPQGWECEQLKADPQVTTAISTVAFEAAVKDVDCATIFIPKQAALTLEMVKRVLGRNALSKTIFWEA